MIQASCRKVSDSCEEVCEKCKQAHENYIEKTEKQYIADAIKLLQSKGYLVLRTNKVTENEMVEQVPNNG